MSTLGSVVLRDVIANRPAASIPGRMFYSTDTNVAYRDNGSSWDVAVANTGSSGTGTVTSVALMVPARQSVTGSPVTSSGTLAITDNTQNANLVFAGPSTGAAAAPTFRTLAPADLPVATTGALGAVKPDGTTITVTGGTISATAATPTIAVGFVLNTGATGTNVGPMIPAARTSTLSRVVVVTKSSDASVPFQFDIRKNGTSIFTGTLPTVAAGTSSGTVSIFTSLTSTPLPVTQDDVFRIDVIQGNSNWMVAVQAET